MTPLFYILMWCYCFNVLSLFFVMIEGNIHDKDDSDLDSDEYTGEIRELLSLPNTSIKDVWASNFE